MPQLIQHTGKRIRTSTWVSVCLFGLVTTPYQFAAETKDATNGKVGHSSVCTTRTELAGTRAATDKTVGVNAAIKFAVSRGQ